MTFEIDMIRFSSDSQSTNTLIFFNGIFQCYCLEDPFHFPKIKKITRIPGSIRCPVHFRTEGRLHEIYKKKFPGFHKGMLHIQNIPDFDLVYFHIGNKADDTEGCPLVGNVQYNNLDSADGQILNSTAAYIEFYQKVSQQLLAGVDVFVNTHDMDRDFRKFIPQIVLFL